MTFKVTSNETKQLFFYFKQCLVKYTARKLKAETFCMYLSIEFAKNISDNIILLIGINKYLVTSGIHCKYFQYVDHCQ